MYYTRPLRGAIKLVWRAGPVASTATASLGLLSGLAPAPAAWITKELIDGITAPTRPPSWILFLQAFGAVAIVAAGAVLAYGSGITSASLAASVQVQTESELAEACATPVSSQFLEDPRTQDLLEFARLGAHQAPNMLTDTAIQYISSLGTVGGYLVAVWVTSPLMVLALVLTSVPLAWIHRKMGARAIAVAESAAASYRWRDYYSNLFTDPVSAREMRVLGAASIFVARLKGHLSDALRAESEQLIRFAWVQIGFTGINCVVAAAGSIFVLIAVVDGRLSVGAFVLFGTAVAALQARLAAVVTLTSKLRVELGSFRAFLKFTADTNFTPGHVLVVRQSVPCLSEAIEFSDVWFRYSSDTPWVLRGLSMRLEAGQSHALVGLNGSGKSTLVQLLFRLCDPQRGQIFWDGVDVREFDATQLRARMAGVLQQYGRYELTALENVTIGDAHRLGDVEAATGAVGEAGLGPLIERLPHGLDTMLSSRRNDQSGHQGVLLSGGEWQRIALARAYMRHTADIVILDEPNSGLDAIAEYELHSRLVAAGSHRTQLLISHRLASLLKVDRLSVLEGGKIIESGAPDYLLSTKGAFSRLYRLQIGQEADPFAETPQ